jgi:glucose-1-phosphate cytidylyltransferase
MVEVGNRPIIWHIMKTYSSYGINDFVICLGYMGFKIKEYFFHYNLHSSDVTIDVRNGGMTVHQSQAEEWRITLVETGLETMTGGRLKRIKPFLGNDQLFCMTYGDGVGNIDIQRQVDFHHSHGRLATVTAVRPLARFGSLVIDSDVVSRFEEKPIGEGGYISGGFFVLSPKVLDYIEGDATLWEKEPMEKLAHENNLMAFRHEGFWQPMDTLRDRQHLNQLWETGQAPWKTWSDGQG